MTRTLFNPAGFILFIVFLLGFPLSLYAESAPEKKNLTDLTSNKYGDWLQICETIGESSSEVCGLVQEVLQKNSGQSVLKIIIRNDSPSRPTILLNLPLGFALPAGVIVGIDKGNVFRHQIQTCTPIGCLAGWQLDADFIATMKQGVRMHVTIQDLQNKPFIIPVSLSGFTKGYASLSEK